MAKNPQLVREQAVGAAPGDSTWQLLRRRQWRPSAPGSTPAGGTGVDTATTICTPGQSSRFAPGRVRCRRRGLMDGPHLLGSTR